MKSELSPAMIFVQGLTTNRDAEIRNRIWRKLEQDSKSTLRSLAEECQRIVNLRHDTARINTTCLSA